MISTKLAQNSDLLNTTLPLLPNINKTLARFQRQNSVHVNTEPDILNTSSQPASKNNQNIHLTPQQLINFVRKFKSQNTQQTTNAPTPYYLQAASTQTPSEIVRRNAQMIYLYLGGSVPMQQSLRTFDVTDPT